MEKVSHSASSSSSRVTHDTKPTELLMIRALTDADIEKPHCTVNIEIQNVQEYRYICQKLFLQLDPSKEIVSADAHKGFVYEEMQTVEMDKALLRRLCPGAAGPDCEVYSLPAVPINYGERILP